MVGTLLPNTAPSHYRSEYVSRRYHILTTTSVPPGATRAGPTKRSPIGSCQRASDHALGESDRTGTRVTGYRRMFVRNWADGELSAFTGGASASGRCKAPNDSCRQCLTWVCFCWIAPMYAMAAETLIDHCPLLYDFLKRRRERDRALLRDDA